MKIRNVNYLTSLPPPITQMFDRRLLMTTLQRMVDDMEQLVELAKKKYRNCAGKKREFEKLIYEFMVMHGRKTAEEAEYKKAYKKNSKRRPIPTKGVTCTFRRFSTT